MEKMFIDSGLLFDRKDIGGKLATKAHRIACGNNPKIPNRIDLLYWLLEEIDGNIWAAYMAKHGIDNAIEKLVTYCRENFRKICDQICDTGYIHNHDFAKELLLVINRLDK